MLVIGAVYAEEPLNYAEQLIKSGEYALAELALQKQIDLHPVEAALLLSYVYLYEGDLDRAQHWLERSREAGLADAAYYWQKGRIESVRSNWSAAWAALRSAVALSPRPAYALLWGVVGLAQGDTERALLGFGKAERSGAGSSAAFLRGLTLLSDAPEQALGLFRKAQAEMRSEDPLKPQAIYWQARALERLGRVKEARSTLRFLLRSYPGYAPARDELNRLGP
jgi:tetratricopeptide (TPR) repeat protein